MPLKLIYQASPLMTPKSLPLRAGSFRCRSPWLADLYRQALPHAEASELWEGLIRLGEAVDGTGRSNAAAEKAQEAAASLNRGEAWPWQGQQALQVARAIWALYEIKPERSLLEAMMRYVSQLPGAWKALQSDAPADLLELLEQLYRAEKINAGERYHK